MNSNWLRFILYKCKFNDNSCSCEYPVGLYRPSTVQAVNRQ